MDKQAHFLPFESLPKISRGNGIVNYVIAGKQLGARAIHTGISELPVGTPAPRHSHTRRRCRQPARQQHDGQHHPLEGQRRLRRHGLRMDALRARRRPEQRTRRSQGQCQRRRFRLPRWGVDRRTRHALDPDRHEHLGDGQRRRRDSATTACWPATHAAARCGAFSPDRPAARSPAPRPRQMAARCSSTSSIRAKARASAASPSSRGASRTGPTTTRRAGRARPRW
jgi:hypothetical protein